MSGLKSIWCQVASPFFRVKMKFDIYVVILKCSLSLWFKYRRFVHLQRRQWDRWLTLLTSIEPCHEIMELFILRKLVLQTRMCSHPMGLDVWFLVGPFVYFHTSCVRSVKALANLRGCAGSHEPSVVAYVISAIISWAGSSFLKLESTDNA